MGPSGPRPVEGSGPGGLPRRRVVAGASAALASLVAGCVSLPDEEPPADRSFDRLHLTAVYLDDGVDLSLPEEVPTVTATNNADLIVLPGETTVGARQAVDWLAADRVLALVGGSSEATWLDWARSDAYRDTFGGEGGADAEPDPYLLVGAAIGTRTTTYRHSWSDTPRDPDLLRALDEVLVDLEARTPV